MEELSVLDKNTEPVPELVVVEPIIPEPVKADFGGEKGTILVTIFENGVEVKFTGALLGRDVLELGITAIVREYRRWKESLAKEGATIGG